MIFLFGFGGRCTVSVPLEGTYEYSSSASILFSGMIRNEGGLVGAEGPQFMKLPIFWGCRNISLTSFPHLQIAEAWWKSNMFNRFYITKYSIGSICFDIGLISC